MNTWDVAPTEDDAVGIAAAAREIMALVSGFRAALDRVDCIEPIWELSENLPSVGRSVVQVRVTPEFFADFFNSSTGYRGMFRRGPRIGNATNAALVDVVRSTLSTVLADTVDACLVRGGTQLELIGRTGIPRSTFLRSFDPSLAKLWYCTAEVSASDGIRFLPFGIESGAIDLGLSEKWAAIRLDDGDCIIEVKGAFVWSCGLFQIKDPEVRARDLSMKGEA